MWGLYGLSKVTNTLSERSASSVQLYICRRFRTSYDQWKDNPYKDMPLPRSFYCPSTVNLIIFGQKTAIATCFTPTPVNQLAHRRTHLHPPYLYLIPHRAASPIGMFFLSQRLSWACYVAPRLFSKVSDKGHP
jgi:hypothetical protein